jgi:hypothetical protein
VLAVLPKPAVRAGELDEILAQQAKALAHLNVNADPICGCSTDREYMHLRLRRNQRRFRKLAGWQRGWGCLQNDCSPSIT